MHLTAILNFKKHIRCANYISTADDSNLPITPDLECFLIDERLPHPGGGNGWNSWYKYKKSTDMLSSFSLLVEAGSGHNQSSKSLCDCYRPSSFRPKQTFENRFIKRSTSFGEINLIYVQNFENYITMSKEYPPFTSFAPTPKRCNTGWRQ